MTQESGEQKTGNRTTGYVVGVVATLVAVALLWYFRFRQIAGLVARRIVNYAEVGHEAVQTEKYGFIKFGSRIDIFLPLGSEVLVRLGDKVVGGQTPLARLKR